MAHCRHSACLASVFKGDPKRPQTCQLRSAPPTRSGAPFCDAAPAQRSKATRIRYCAASSEANCRAEPSCMQAVTTTSPQKGGWKAKARTHIESEQHHFSPKLSFCRSCKSQSGDVCRLDSSPQRRTPMPWDFDPLPPRQPGAPGLLRSQFYRLPPCRGEAHLKPGVSCAYSHNISDVTRLLQRRSVLLHSLQHDLEPKP